MDLQFMDSRNGVYRCSNRKCKREDVGFSSQSDLDSHNNIHLQQITNRICPICDKILASLVKLCNHMITRHTQKCFTCDNCGKIFRSKDNLRLHMSHHRKHFKVECRACKKSYKSMQSLRYHLRQHFEHHQCETCGKVRGGLE
jgi:KRAB domain-containing zinc finger protein